MEDKDKKNTDKNLKDYLTVSEFAKILNMTPQGLRYHIQDLDGERETNRRGHIILSPNEQQILREWTQNLDKQKDKKEQENTDKNIENLWKQILYERETRIDEKNKLIIEKDKLIEDLQNRLNEQTRLLDQSQQLQASAQRQLSETLKEKQLLVEYKEEQEKKKGFWSRLFGN